MCDILKPHFFLIEKWTIISVKIFQIFKIFVCFLEEAKCKAFKHGTNLDFSSEGVAEWNTNQYLLSTLEKMVSSIHKIVRESSA